MRITQGTFAFLPELTDEEIGLQIDYALQQGWACSVEFTDDPHPRNTYWEMWGLPMFDLHDAAGVMQEVNACRKAHPEEYVRINAFDATHGWETVRLSFIVHRPTEEAGFPPRVAARAGEGPPAAICYPPPFIRNGKAARSALWLMLPPICLRRTGALICVPCTRTAKSVHCSLSSTTISWVSSP